MVDIDRLIQVTTRIAATGVPRLPFGRVLLVTTDPNIAAAGSGKVRLFENLEDATDVLGSSAARTAAGYFFAADPNPQGLYVGRWANADVATELRGGTPAAVTAAPLSAANASFTLNGTDVAVDLSAVTIDTYAEIATAVQAALQTGFAGATFAFEDGRFVLTLAGSTPIDGGAFSNTAVATDTDIAASLGMAAATDDLAYILGSSQETVAQALSRMLDAIGDNPPVGIGLVDGLPDVGGVDTRLAVSEFAEAGNYVFVMEDSADQALSDAASDTTSHAAQVLNLARGKTAVVYGSGVAMGLLGLMSGQNLSQPNSSITPHGKGLASVPTVTLTNDQITNLEAKRVSYVARVYGSPTLLGGYTSRASHWIDSVWWNIWLTDRLQRAIWSAQRGSRRLTRALLIDGITEALQAGVSNGGIQPGRTVSSAIQADIINATGNLTFDGVLAAGYLVHVPAQTDAERASREGRFNVWCVGAEAIHKVEGDVLFQN